MKKLLSILLTLVMAICLVNLNNNYSKAQDNPAAEISLYFKNGQDGTLSLYTDEAGTTEYEGKGTTWNVTANNELELNNFNLETSATDAITISSEATGLVLKGKNKIVLSRQTIAGSNDTINGIYIDNSTDDFSISGNGSLTLDTSGIGGEGNNVGISHIVSHRPLLLNARINLNDKPIEALRTYGYSIVRGIRDLKGDIVIVGGNIDITFDNSQINVAVFSKNFIIEDGKITIDITTSSNGYQLGIDGNDGYEQNGGIVEINITTSLNVASCNIRSLDSLTRTTPGVIKINKGTLILSTSQAKAELMDARAGDIPDSQIVIAKPWYKSEDYTIVGQINENKYLRNKNGEHLSYIKLIIGDEPTPTPEPQPKDESCEKVIGPTWHWNNTKGVCEEYSTVGTYTR